MDLGVRITGKYLSSFLEPVPFYFSQKQYLFMTYMVANSQSYFRVYM